MKRILPIAKEAWPIVGPVAFGGAGALLLEWFLVGGSLFACALGLALFFRDPKREAPNSPTEIFCPADGRVVGIAEVHEGDYLEAKSCRVSIFMSLFDVHINYAPMAGRVQYVKYRKGGFRRANLPEASESNENNSIGILGNGHRVMVRQIAGAIARRIVCRVRVDDAVKPGQKIGLIKFGSRVDLFIPASWEVLVRIGQQVKGGISPIARIA